MWNVHQWKLVVLWAVGALLLLLGQPHPVAAWTWNGPPRVISRWGHSIISRRQLQCRMMIDPVQVAELVQPHVVLVSPTGVRNVTARGSGFVLQEESLMMPQDSGCTWILTAAHVTPPGYSIQVSWPHMPSNKFSATVMGRNATLDLALLRVETSLPPNKDDGLQLYQDPFRGLVPPVGTLVFAHGYPASRLRGPAMTSGIVCGIADGLGIPDDTSNGDNGDSSSSSSSSPPQRQTTYVVTNAAMSGGMSGGPLVDSTGKVVGVNALIRPDLRALGNYAVSSVEVQAFLQDCKSRLARRLRINGSDATEVVVWLYNDGRNKKERVASILEQVAGLNGTMAQQVMMEAHTTGRGKVASFASQENATILGQALRNQDLLVEWEVME